MRSEPPSPREATRPARRPMVVCSLLAVLSAVSIVWCLGAAGATAWRWPLQPRPAVLSRFAPPAQAWDAGRRGVELAAAVGEPVRAPAAGIIVFAGVVAGIPTVSVDHGELVSTYQPVLAAASRGTPVTAGAVLGRVQDLPRLCGASTCLRWGVYVDGSSPRRYADPLALVGAAPVRLLPPAAAAGLPATVAADSGDDVETPATGRAAARSSRPSGRLGALSTTAVAVTLLAGAGLALPAAAALVGSAAGRRGGRGRRRGGAARQDR